MTRQFIKFSPIIFRILLHSLACKQEDDNEMCDIAAALASSSRRSIERGDLVVTPVKNTDVQLRHGAAASFVPSTAKLDIQLLNECAGHNCTRQLDLSHGGVSHH